MGGIHSVCACALACAAISLSGCASNKDSLDLALNPSLYKAPGYKAKVPADRVAFVGPVVDDRDSVAAEEASGPYPMRWMPEGYWDRSLPEMVDDCLRDAFVHSEVFASLQEAPPPAADALIVEPHLLTARAGQEERVFGRRSLSDVSIRLVVHGPAGPDGERPILMDEQFDQTVGTDITPQPPRIPTAMGSALTKVLSRILARVDQSNVARSGMPIQAAPEPVER